MALTKNQYLAAHIRDALTNAAVDLATDSKRRIEGLIERTLSESEAKWPAFNQEQTEREQAHRS